MTDTTAATSATTTEAGDAQAEANVDTAVQTEAQTPATDKPAEAVVPEAYEFAMPEGITLDKTASDEFSAVAKELKLDQATAQKVADVGIKMAQRQQEVFETTKAAWAEQSRTDKDIGGDNFDQNMAVALKTLNTFGSPELKDVLNASGLGNHPAVIKLLVKAGKAISDDGFVSGSPKGAETDMAKKMFPSMN